MGNRRNEKTNDDGFERYPPLFLLLYLWVGGGEEAKDAIIRLLLLAE